MIHDLNFGILTHEEKENLPNGLTALPPLKFNHLKRELNPLYKNIDPSMYIQTLY